MKMGQLKQGSVFRETVFVAIQSRDFGARSVEFAFCHLAMQIWRQSVSSRGSSKYKGPEVGRCAGYQRNKSVTAAWKGRRSER